MGEKQCGKRQDSQFPLKVKREDQENLDGGMSGRGSVKTDGRTEALNGRGQRQGQGKGFYGRGAGKNAKKCSRPRFYDDIRKSGASSKNSMKSVKIANWGY